MKIIELFEQTMGTIGSTSGQTTTINPISNQPSDKPSSATSVTTSTTDTNNRQLDNILKQNQINVKSTDDFLRAYDAIQQKTEISKLPPEQQQAISDYTKATINKPNLPNQMSGIMKTLIQKPTIGNKS